MQQSDALHPADSARPNPMLACGSFQKGEKTLKQSKLLGDWMSPSEAAELLGLSHTTLLNWCKSGAVPATKLPSGRFLLKREYVESLDQLIIREGDDE